MGHQRAAKGTETQSRGCKCTEEDGNQGKKERNRWRQKFRSVLSAMGKVKEMKAESKKKKKKTPSSNQKFC